MMLSYWYVRVERCRAVSASAGGRGNERYGWVLLLITALLRLLVAVMVPLGSGRPVRSGPSPEELEPLRKFGAQTWAQALLKFVLSDHRVSCAIPATSSPDRMSENARAGEPPWFGDEERRYVAELVRR
jgi:diketogulonate reductase-like aldo/keto reductase